MAKGVEEISQGFSLIEVLIAVLVLSIGLLGLAGLQTKSMGNTHSAYLRTQANFLIYDLIDRMRTNRTLAQSGNYNIAFDTGPNGTTNCETATCTATEMAAFDLNQWKCSLGKWNSNSICANTLSISGRLPNGDGAVTQNGDLFTVQIRWDDRDGKLVTLNVETEL